MIAARTATTSTYVEVLEIEELALPTEVCNPAIALLMELKFAVVGSDPMALVTLVNPDVTEDARVLTEEAVAVMAVLIAVKLAPISLLSLARAVLREPTVVWFASWLLTAKPAEPYPQALPEVAETTAR